MRSRVASVGKTLQVANVSTIAIVEVEKHSVELREKNCLRRRKESLQVTNSVRPKFWCDKLGHGMEVGPLRRRHEAALCRKS